MFNGNIVGEKTFDLKVAIDFCEAKAKEENLNSDFMFVRFGNVLGSRGSVLPLFMSQIQTGGPITVTDKNMQRYFMTIPEACSLVLKTGGVGKNGFSYLLDMGEQSFDRVLNINLKGPFFLTQAAAKRMIANKKSWKSAAKRAKIEQLKMLLLGALDAQKRVLLKLNAPAKNLEKIVKALPALHAPTVNKLNDDKWYAVESVVEERLVRDLIPALTKCGATGIIELPLNKIIY